MTAALEGGEWSEARLGRTLAPEKTRYPFYRRLGGPQGRSGWAENLVPTGIRSRTVQPVVSRYTDWGTRPRLVLPFSCIISTLFHHCLFKFAPNTSTYILTSLYCVVYVITYIQCAASQVSKFLYLFNYFVCNKFGMHNFLRRPNS